MHIIKWVNDAMIIKKAFKKILITTFLFFFVLTICIIPSKSKKTNIELNTIDTETVDVYLMNDFNQLTKVDIKVNKESLETSISSIIKKLTRSFDATIPNHLVQVIPENVKLKEIQVDEGIVYLNFSKEFLDISNSDIEKVAESISYSILSINGITGVSIYVEEENISKLYPVNIPSIITKDYGINKRYAIKNVNDISKVVIYYLTDIDDKRYFVPITKYVNDDREKIKIIVDELSSNYIYESNLISLLDRNLKLLDYCIVDDEMILDFNNSIFVDKNDILEEVVYAISYSIFDNYDVNEVVFKVNGEEFVKKVQKVIE